jgi:hypothetical protein
MKSTSLFLAAAFALCANAAFAQTVPSSAATPGTTVTTPGIQPSTVNSTRNDGASTNNNSMMGAGTMGGAGTMDKATTRSARRANKGTKMKSRTQMTNTSTGTM